jgi:hypothetical protein
MIPAGRGRLHLRVSVRNRKFAGFGTGIFVWCFPEKMMGRKAEDRAPDTAAGLIPMEPSFMEPGKTW